MTQLIVQPSPGNGSSVREMKFELLDRFLGKSGLFWNRLPITPELIKAWFEEIEPFTAKCIEQGMKDYFRSEQFFPVPGTLIPHIKFNLDGDRRPNFLETK